MPEDLTHIKRFIDDTIDYAEIMIGLEPGEVYEEQPKPLEPWQKIAQYFEVHEEIVLRSGTPISELSNRELPSPSAVKGEHNLLLLPYYQEHFNPKETIADK